ncbi:HAD-IA family hydrolase [Niallia sp. FSL M8-0099]|uniref:HAD-IA family hydrolase n=1 Tax=Niallia sp. FSL M8-0099 TaxID=2954519 RepID=UPI0030F86E6B
MNLQELWRLDYQLSHLESIIKKADIISFDIFDTLLLRLVAEPTALFMELGKAAKEEGLFKRDLSIFEFKQIRILSEQLARKEKREKLNKIEEITIYDIYRQMPDIFDKNALINLELQLENKYCYINPVIYSLIKFCKKNNKKIYLISDMYLSSKQIKEIIAFNGFDFSLVDEIISSSEYKVTKQEGKLFEEIKNKYSLSYEKWIHIGDNELADVQQALYYGIEGTVYNAKDKNNGCFQYEKIMYGDLLPEIYSLRKISSNLHHKYNEGEKFWYRLGTQVMGPFLSLFAEWILDIAEKENIQQIRPFMREGILLEKVLKEAAKARKLDIDIACLYVSREATSFTSIKEINLDFIESFFDRRGYTIKELLQKFNIQEIPKVFQSFLEIKLKEASNINIDNRTLKQIVIQFLMEQDNKDILLELNKKGQLFYKYLEQNIDLSKPFITVDLGFRGTIQDNIDLLLKTRKVDFQSTHLMATGTEIVKYKIQKGMDIRGFMGNAGEHSDLIKYILTEPAIIEELHMDETGSTLYYIEEANKVLPFLEENQIPKKEIELKKVCQRGVLDFQNQFLELSKKKPFIKEKLLKDKRQICKVIARLYTLPTFEEASNLIHLHHDDNFGSKSVVSLYNEEDFDKLEHLGIEKFLEVAKFNQILWPEAKVTIKHPGFLIYKTIRTSDQLPQYMIETMQCANKLAYKNVKEVVIYGAGEIGHALIESLKLFNIEVLAFIDKKESLWGNTIDGVEVVSVKEAQKLNFQHVVIASFLFINEIKQTIFQNFSDVQIYEMDNIQ